MFRQVVCCAAAAVVLFACGARAERSAGSSSMIIAKLPVGARAIALSGAYSAVAEGPATVYWNPAGLAAVPRMRLEGLHVEQGEEIRMENVLLARPMPFGASLGAGLSYLSQPPIDRVLEDSSGNFAGVSGTFSVWQFKGAIGYGQDLSRLAPVAALGDLWSRGAVGASLTMLGESIGDTRSYSTSIDLGYLYTDHNSGRRFAVVARQLGMQVRGSPLPVTGELGFGQTIGNWLFAFNMLTASDDSIRIRGGIEWGIQTATGDVALRAGGQESLSSHLANPMSFGIGYRLDMPGGSDFALDYSFVPVEDFEDIHAISIQIGL